MGQEALVQQQAVVAQDTSQFHSVCAPLRGRGHWAAEHLTRQVAEKIYPHTRTTIEL